MPQLITIGMHRSNTSLIGKAIQNAGLFIGNDLMEATQSNKEGYFEDKDIIDFEDRIFKSDQKTWYFFSPNQLDSLNISDSFYQEGEDLLKKKFGQHQAFGWKSPRTTILLSFWKKIIPDAKYLMVFRHPGLVAQSLVKRGDMWKFTKIRPYKYVKALNIWYTYNLAMIDFYQKNKDNCIIIESPNILGNQDQIQQLNYKIIDKWKIPIQPLDFGKAVNPALLNKEAKPFVKWLTSLTKKELKLYQQLQKNVQEQFAMFETV